MAQLAIREYDAKKMFADFSEIPYQGFLTENVSDLDRFDQLGPDYAVIKPDQLFGKRGKYGLVGVRLDRDATAKWWQEHMNREITIGKQSGKLTTFLVEPFVTHEAEYYVAIKTERDHDVMYFSENGGIDVEENWDKIQEIKIPLIDQQNHTDENFDAIFSHIHSDTRICHFLRELYRFFVDYGFVYLEVNPFTFDKNGLVVCLDMVARVDSCENFRQKEHWKNLTFINPFGVQKSEAEKYIDALDAETGASLKFRILNPDGRIWLLTSGGGASVIIADTLADLGFADVIGNYGECSGNPDRENTRAYADTLIRTMLANAHTGQYLIIAGAIANFTHIDRTFAGIIDALETHAENLRKHHIKILVRRGGINDIEGLNMIKKSCEELAIPCEIADGNTYMTDILGKIQLGNLK